MKLNNGYSPEIIDLITEAYKFRYLLEVSDKQNTELVTSDFPVVNCNLSSLLFIYHLLSLWPKLEIYGVNGLAVDNYGENTISHYWIEVGDVAIDLTGDQYNEIDALQLNREIVEARPFQPVLVANKTNTLLYRLFNIIYREKYISGFSSLGEDVIDKMRIGHSQLMKYYKSDDYIRDYE